MGLQQTEKSFVNNDEWREKLNVVGDMLSALRRRLKIAKAAGHILHMVKER